MISFIIINYRQKNLLQKCVNSIQRNIHSFPYEIIIVNNSPEENLIYLEKTSRNILVVSNGNRGFSQANNFGVKFSNYPYLFFLNADTEFTKDFLGDLLKKIPPDFGAAGPGLIYPGGGFQLSSWHENTFFNEIKNKKDEEAFRKSNAEQIELIKNNFNTVKEVDWVTGAGMIVRKDVFNKAGGFDESFFLFYEDADLCKRIQEKGLKIFYYPGAGIIHYKGENINRSFSTGTYYHSKESQILYYKKHNSFFDNFLLRIYLFMKFLFLSIATFRRINFRIFLLSSGIKTKS